jgi:hypothetical protein
MVGHIHFVGQKLQLINHHFRQTQGYGTKRRLESWERYPLCPLPLDVAGRVRSWPELPLSLFGTMSWVPFSWSLLYFSIFSEDDRHSVSLLKKIEKKGSAKIIFGKCVQGAPFPAQQSARNKFPGPIKRLARECNFPDWKQIDQRSGNKILTGLVDLRHRNFLAVKIIKKHKIDRLRQQKPIKNVEDQQ